MRYVDSIKPRIIIKNGQKYLLSHQIDKDTAAFIIAKGFPTAKVSSPLTTPLKYLFEGGIIFLLFLVIQLLNPARNIFHL